MTESANRFLIGIAGVLIGFLLGVFALSGFFAIPKAIARRKSGSTVPICRQLERGMTMSQALSVADSTDQFWDYRLDGEKLTLSGMKDGCIVVLDNKLSIIEVRVDESLGRVDWSTQ